MARVAALLADPTRATILVALLDGRAWTCSELARGADVSVATASEHLTRMVAFGLLTEERQGRHRYLRLAGSHVAELVETLMGFGPESRPVPSLRAARANLALGRARTCYDHLAGRLGVLLLDALVDRRVVDRSGGLAVTPDGRHWLAGLGIDIDAMTSATRPLLRECLDWTERRPHLSGGLGAALCRHIVDSGWVLRSPGSRAVRLTSAGASALHDGLGLPLEQLADEPLPAGSGRA